MSLTLPTPVLLFRRRGDDPSDATLAAVVPRPTSPRRLFAEVLGTSLAGIGIVWLAWLALWVLDQRW